MAHAMGWIETMSVAMTRKEPKTPMAFYSRMIWIITALIVAPLYSNIPPEYKVVFTTVGVVLAVGLFVWVSIFAWKKPKYLLYGAESHFEEWRMAYGSDAGTTNAAINPINPQHS